MGTVGKQGNSYAHSRHLACACWINECSDQTLKSLIMEPNWTGEVPRGQIIGKEDFPFCCAEPPQPGPSAGQTLLPDRQP